MNKTPFYIFLPSVFSFKTLFCLGCLLIILLFQPAQAQILECGTDPVSNAVGCFTINTIYNGIPYKDITKVCVGVPIQVANCKAINNLKYYFDDKKGSEVTSDSTHTYTVPGTYTILQQGSGNPPVLCIHLRKTIVVVSTPPPVFSLSTCTGKRVLLSIPGNDPSNAYDEYLIEWGDGQSEVATSAGTLPHNYGSGGVKTVKVTGRYKPVGCGNSATGTVTPVDALTLPQLTKLVVNNEVSVDLFFTPTQDFPTYDIQERIPPGGYSSILQVTNPTAGQPIRIVGLTTPTNTYCFQVIASDVCGQTQVVGELCTERINAVAVNNQNNLTWPVYGGSGLQSYQLFRDGKLLRSFPPLSTTKFSDTDVRCAQYYCYQLVVQTGNAQSVSLPACVTAISDVKPSTLTNLTASVVEGKTVVTWQKPAQFAVRNYTIERSVNGDAFKIYSQIAANPGQFTDSQRLNDTTRYCYRVSYTDSCSKVADFTGATCPIWLMKVVDPASADPYQLEWTAYENWTAGVNTYVLEWLDADGNVRKKEDLSGTSLKFSEKEMDTVQQVLYFRVKAVSNDAVPLVSYSNVVEYVQALRLFLPDAFTPNTDGLNDKYVVKGLFVRNYRMQIYNRWGELVFVSNDINEGWNGKVKGNPAPGATYVCRIEAMDYRGKMTQVNKLFVLIN